MKGSAWIITGVLTVLAIVAGWFFGLDPAHAVVLAEAGLAAGIANGVLESVDVPQPVLTPLPHPVRGLADIQALEFSLSAAGPGTRAILELHTLARDAIAAAGPALTTTTLHTFAAGPAPTEIRPRELRSLIDDLERLVRHTDPPTSTRRAHEDS